MNSKARKESQHKAVGDLGVKASSPEGDFGGIEPPVEAAHWTFLSNHTHVLLCLAGQPEQTLRDVAARVGITERAVQRIVADLESAGVLRREREGRRNRYELDLDAPLRHPLERHRSIGDILTLLLEPRP